MMGLAQKLIELIEITKDRMNDNDQRSAIGIADSFVRGSMNIDTPLAKYDDDGPLNRDGLAASLIEAIANADKSDAQNALHAARMVVNAPFANDPKILAWRRSRHEKYPEGIGVASK